MPTFTFTKANRYSPIAYHTVVGDRRLGLYRARGWGWVAECLDDADAGVTGTGETRELAVIAAIKSAERRGKQLAGCFGHVHRSLQLS